MAILNLTYGSGTYLRVIEYDYDDVAHQVTNGSISGTVIPSGVGPDVEVYRQDGVDGEYWSVRSQNAAPYAYVVYVGAPLSITDVDKVDAMNGNLGSVIGTGSGNGTKRWTLSPFAGPQVSNVFSNVPPGNYTLILSRLEDIDIDSQSVTIEDIPDLQATVTGTNCTAFDADDGQVTVSGLVGSGDYTLTFVTEDVVVNVDGSAPYVRTNLTPRGYLIVVLDNITGQSENFLITITEPAFVCNLFFFEPGTVVVNASGPSTPNGSITVSVFLHPYPFFPKYNLNSDFDYVTQGQASSTFSNLVPGTYTVYARTGDNCLRTLEVIVGYTLVYNPRWRLQYQSVNGGHQCRFDIDDNQFVGAVTDLIGAGQSPVIISARGEALEDPFFPVIGSEASVSIISETDDQFAVFKAFDESRFRGTFYVFEGGNYVQKWQGFLIPMTGAEPYVQSFNYPIELKFVDGLSDLGNYPFSDDANNMPLQRLSLMSAIVFCLNKTKLQLAIHETVNIYETSMSIANQNDSTLDQLYFDPLVYRQQDGTMEDCLTVLKSLLLNLGARITQSNGVWAIDCATLKTGSTTSTRIKASNGGPVSGEDVPYRYMLRRKSANAPKFVFRDQSAFKNITQMYGKIKLSYDFGVEEENNMLINGSFQDEDIVNGQLENWQIDYSQFSPPIVNAEIIEDTSTDHKKVLKQSFRVVDGIASQQRIFIASRPIPVGLSQYTKLRFSFDVYTSPTVKDTYITVDSSLTIKGGSPFDAVVTGAIAADGHNELTSIPGAFLIDGEYFRNFIDSHDEWKTIVIETVFDPAIMVPNLTGNLQARFAIDCNPIYDYDSVISLRTENTNNALNYKRRRVYDPSTNKIRHYTLVQGTETDNSDTYIRPFDYSIYLWKLDKMIDVPGTTHESFLRYILIDNVQVQYLPNGQEPQIKSETEIILTPNISQILEANFRHGDLLADHNYKSITKGWFSLSDGTPTALWRIRGAGADGIDLISLLKGLYQGHYQAVRQKLTGDVICDGIFPWPGNTIYEVRSGKIHAIVANSIDTKQGLATIEIIEALTGEPQTDEGDPDPNVEPPVNIREHSNEFSLEFT